MSCKFFGFLHDIDMFGKPPEFYLKGKTKKSTFIGRLFTVLYLIVYIAFFIYKLIQMIKRVDVTFYDTFAFTGEVPSIHLNSDNFYGGFGILGPNGEPFVNELIYNATAIFWSGKKKDGVWTWESKDVGLERCRLERFGVKYRDMFKDKDLNNMYCLKDMDVVFEGYATSDSYSYFEVKLFPCIGTNCAPKSYIEAAITRNNFMFKMQDIELTPQNYSYPVQEREKDISGPVYSTLLQQIYAYLQVTNIETDEDIIGFGLSNIKKEKYLKYDESWIISAPMLRDVYTSGDPLCVITVQLSEKALTQKRQYTTLIEVLGDVGGLMEVISVVVNLFLSIIIDILYEKSMINNLFEFDLDKKVIIIKEKEKEKKKERDNIFKNNDTPKIFTPRNSMPNAVQSSIYVNDGNNTIQTKNKLNEEPLSKNALEEKNFLEPKKLKISKKKKKKKMKMINSMENQEINNPKSTFAYQNILKKEEDNKKVDNNLEKNTEKEKEFIFINSKDGQNINMEEEKDIGNRRIVKKIKMNKFCTYLCFFCSRKRKNLENILLDEGMNIVVEQLDVINMFKKLHKDGIIQKTLNRDPIQLSDECKMNMNDIINKMYHS